MITMRRLSQEPRSHFDAFHPSELERGVGTETEANSLYLGLTRWMNRSGGCTGRGFCHNPKVLIHRTLSPLRWRLWLDKLASPGAVREPHRVLRCSDAGKFLQFSIPQLSYPQISGRNAFLKELVSGLK